MDLFLFWKMYGFSKPSIWLDLVKSCPVTNLTKWNKNDFFSSLPAISRPGKEGHTALKIQRLTIDMEDQGNRNWCTFNIVIFYQTRKWKLKCFLSREKVNTRDGSRQFWVFVISKKIILGSSFPKYKSRRMSWPPLCNSLKNPEIVEGFRRRSLVVEWKHCDDNFVVACQ